MWQSAIWIFAVDWILRIGFAIHVVMRRQPIGISLSWLMIVLLFPFIGPLIYVLLGENWLGVVRSKWAAKMGEHYKAWKSRQTPWIYNSWSDPLSDPAQLSRIVAAASGEQPLGGNGLTLLHSAEAVFESMIADIDRAQACCNMEFYIWEVGGVADDFCASLSKAAQRGIQVRILVDAVGSRGFLRSPQCAALREAGAEVRAALVVSPLRALFYRFDLRMHRKTLIIDDRVGYVGSQNIADPKIFRNGAGFGQWVDAMARIVGPAVDSLSMVFFEDWHFEQADYGVANQWESVRPIPAVGGSAPVQVIPSGPGTESEAIMQILINAIYMADHDLLITTPYFVPDESLQRALISASRRGVDVTLVVPQRVDSRLVRLASRPFLRQLAAAGVTVAEYHAGMLHTKSITIDRDTSFFGSLNLDPRSLELNFELMLVIYDETFTRDLIALQKEYVRQSHILTPDRFALPSVPVRFAESCVRLISPLL
jgi:cardiolipin synthase A/B